MMQIVTRSYSRISVFRAIIVIALLSVIVQAQDPFVVAPQAYKLAFENDWVRVVRVHYAPNEKIPAHDHPKRQSIFLYLNDGGPVRFKHVEGASGSFPATRPATKAGAFRLALGLSENHIVENTSDLPSDFLQVELKTEKAEAEKFRGRFIPEPQRLEGNYRKVEFENAQIRITRLVSAASSKSETLEPSTYPGMLIALSPVQFKVKAKGKSKSDLKLKLGETKWLEPGNFTEWQNAGKTVAETLLIEFKTKPVKG
jgi:hypothetical protein